MLNLEIKTKLSPEEAVKQAVAFFGPDGYGLEVKENYKNHAYFVGSGGSALVVGLAEDAVSTETFVDVNRRPAAGCDRVDYRAGPGHRITSGKNSRYCGFLCFEVGRYPAVCDWQFVAVISEGEIPAKIKIGGLSDRKNNLLGIDIFLCIIEFGREVPFFVEH